VSARRKAARAVAVLTLAFAAASAFAMEPAASRLPAPGTYVLRPIQRMPEASLLDSKSQPAALAAFTRGAVTALGFFYSRCADPLGCPVAWSTFEQARKQAEADPLLKGRLRLVFVSLDPTRDTPSVMRMLETEEKDGEVPWVFLTGASEAQIDVAAAALPYRARAKDRFIRVSDGATYEVSGVLEDGLARVKLRVVRLGVQ